MKVGDYVRTKQGIEKIKVVEENFMGDENCIFYATDNKEWNGAYNGKYNGFTNRNRTIIKSSPNIIELIQVGDYVNGCPVLHKENNELVCGFLLRYKEKDIKAVVTKEQFSQMEYRIGE